MSALMFSKTLQYISVPLRRLELYICSMGMPYSRSSTVISILRSCLQPRARTSNASDALCRAPSSERRSVWSCEQLAKYVRTCRKGVRSRGCMETRSRCCKPSKDGMRRSRKGQLPHKLRLCRLRKLWWGASYQHTPLGPK